MSLGEPLGPSAYGPQPLEIFLETFFGNFLDRVSLVSNMSYEFFTSRDFPSREETRKVIP